MQADAPYAMYDVHIDGTYLYTLNYYGMRIYDISNPTTLPYGVYVEVDHMGNRSKVIVEDNIAYVSDMVSNIVLVNCHDIANAAVFTSFTVGDYFDEITHFDVKGDYMYIIVEGVLKVFNLTVLTSPTLIDTYGNESYTISDFHIDNDKLYALNPTLGFDIINITNPSNLTVLGLWHAAGNYYSLHKDTNYLYLLDSTKAITIFSVSSPSTPTSMDSFMTSWTSDYIDFTINGNELLILTNLGFVMYDIGTLYSQSNIGNYTREDETLSFTAIAVTGNYVYLSSEYDIYGEDLYLLDVTNPNEPILLLPADRPWYWGSLILSILMSLLYYVIPGIIVALIIFFVVRFFRRRDRREFRDIEKVAIKKEKKKLYEKEW
jgi:hypothetical protein